MQKPLLRSIVEAQERLGVMLSVDLQNRLAALYTEEDFASLTESVAEANKPQLMKVALKQTIVQAFSGEIFRFNGYQVEQMADDLCDYMQACCPSEFMKAAILYGLILQCLQQRLERRGVAGSVIQREKQMTVIMQREYEHRLLVAWCEKGCHSDQMQPINMERSMFVLAFLAVRSQCRRSLTSTFSVQDTGFVFTHYTATPNMLQTPVRQRKPESGNPRLHFTLQNQVLQTRVSLQYKVVKATESCTGSGEGSGSGSGSGEGLGIQVQIRMDSINSVMIPAVSEGVLRQKGVMGEGHFVSSYCCRLRPDEDSERHGAAVFPSPAAMLGNLPNNLQRNDNEADQFNLGLNLGRDPGVALGWQHANGVIFTRNFENWTHGMRCPDNVTGNFFGKLNVNAVWREGQMRRKQLLTNHALIDEQGSLRFGFDNAEYFTWDFGPSVRDGNRDGVTMQVWVEVSTTFWPNRVSSTFHETRVAQFSGSFSVPLPKISPRPPPPPPPPPPPQWRWLPGIRRPQM